jgi:hypothetical protein
MKRGILFLLVLSFFFRQGLAQEWLAAKSFGACEGSSIFDLVAPSTNGFIVGGTFSAPSIEVESITIESKGLYNLLVAGFDGDLNTQWAISLGAEGDLRMTGLGVDKFGNIFFATSFSGLFFETGLDTIFNMGGTDALLLKLNPAGGVEWVRHFGSPVEDISGSLVVDDEGNVYFEHVKNDFEGNYFQEIIKVNAGGETVWRKQSIDGCYVRKLLLTDDNRLVIAGEFWNGFSFDDGVSINAPGAIYTVFAVIYNLNGSHSASKVYDHFLICMI